MSGARYPISQLISELVAKHASSEAEFVSEVLSYRDLERGMRRLKCWTETGKGPNSIIKGIAWATERGPELDEAIKATEAIKSQEAEAAFRERCEAEAESFRPFLLAIGQRSVPSPIFAYALGGWQFRLIEFPQRLLYLDVEDQARALRPLLLQYSVKYEGLVPLFGKLTGFRLVKLVDYLQFDAAGNFVELVDRPYRVGTCTLSIK